MAVLTATAASAAAAQLYEAQRAMLKQLPDAVKAATTALKATTNAVAALVASLDGLQRALEQLAAVPTGAASGGGDTGVGDNASPTCAALLGVCTGMATQIAALRRDALPQFASLVQTECCGHLGVLDSTARRVEAVRMDRKKVVESFEALLAEKAEKETEYERKGRPLTESKAYGPLAAKVAERLPVYQAATANFAGEAAALALQSERTAAHVLQCALEHTSGVCCVVHNALYAVFSSTARWTHRASSRSSELAYWGSSSGVATSADGSMVMSPPVR